MAVLKPCDNCPGMIVVGMRSPIRLPVLDAEGNPHPTERITLQLPQHAVHYPNKFDPTGLVPAPCRHGLAEHPDPDVRKSPHARAALSWIRGNVLRVGLKNGLPLPGCPACFGDPLPPEALQARDGSPVGETWMERQARLVEEGLPE